MKIPEAQRKRSVKNFKNRYDMTFLIKSDLFWMLTFLQLAFGFRTVDQLRGNTIKI